MLNSSQVGALGLASTICMHKPSVQIKIDKDRWIQAWDPGGSWNALDPDATFLWAPL
jgi:hypothetical protein